ncbi:hypothetical protein [Streptomyces rapamycinicus]|uniref:Uncharacterized protein n=1 Tax=Streptomyces rapamycinicus TaxID=1226757 RepID=A0ABR6LYT4_9ACTN|nr:hypothetical protein [Streptomyces rapamycinicus]MBB4787344.1 hypothetical protein [Streptomyces rapamycinicus]UTP36916.1 hypothetical protein LIV37_51580 [Streptomyces rapamycinicus NRRL 5491]
MEFPAFTEAAPLTALEIEALRALQQCGQTPGMGNTSCRGQQHSGRHRFPARRTWAHHAYGW